MQLNMRYILLDLGNCDQDALSGKDLALTNAPKVVLERIAKGVKTSCYQGLPAEELFAKEVILEGYAILLLESLDELESISVSADDY